MLQQFQCFLIVLHFLFGYEDSICRISCGSRAVFHSVFRSHLTSDVGFDTVGAYNDVAVDPFA
jgi:hypothetical protein